jgi:hypothetical protein
MSVNPQNPQNPDPKVTDPNAQIQPPAPNPEADPEGKSKDKETNLAALRKQNETLKKENQAFKEAEAERERKRLEEEGQYQELLKKEREEGTEKVTKYQTKVRRYQVEKQLSNSGINPDVIELLIDKLITQVEFDDDDSPTNLEEVVEELKTSKPSLFSDKAAKPAGKVGTSFVSNAGGQEPNKLSQEEIDRIIKSGDADLISKNADKIKASLQ